MSFIPVGTHTKEQFDTALKTFLEGAQQIINKHFATYHQNLTPDTLETDPGRKYIRIWAVRGGTNGSGKSAWGFIDSTNGDVLKAASWKAPAKHARGNIFDEKNGLGTITSYGPAYLR